MSEKVIYEFEWDPAKALANARKHGVTFDQAATVFLDAWALTVFDTEHSQHEERWFTLGLDPSGVGGGAYVAGEHAGAPASAAYFGTAGDQTRTTLL